MPSIVPYEKGSPIQKNAEKQQMANQETVYNTENLLMLIVMLCLTEINCIKYWLFNGNENTKNSIAACSVALIFKEFLNFKDEYGSRYSVLQYSPLGINEYVFTAAFTNRLSKRL